MTIVWGPTRRFTNGVVASHASPSSTGVRHVVTHGLLSKYPILQVEVYPFTAESATTFPSSFIIVLRLLNHPRVLLPGCLLSFPFELGPRRSLRSIDKINFSSVTVTKTLTEQAKSAPSFA